MTGCGTCGIEASQHQVMSAKKKGQVDADPYTFEGGAGMVPEAWRIDDYFEMLHTYLLALSIDESG